MSFIKFADQKMMIVKWLVLMNLLD